MATEDAATVRLELSPRGWEITMPSRRERVACESVAREAGGGSGSGVFVRRPQPALRADRPGRVSPRAGA